MNASSRISSSRLCVWSGKRVPEEFLYGCAWHTIVPSDSRCAWRKIIPLASIAKYRPNSRRAIPNRYALMRNNKPGNRRNFCKSIENHEFFFQEAVFSAPLWKKERLWLVLRQLIALYRKARLIPLPAFWLGVASQCVTLLDGKQKDRYLITRVPIIK